MVETQIKDDITQLQLENRDLNKRVETIEKSLGCPNCGHMKVWFTKGEMHCNNCMSTFINKGGNDYGK